MNGIVMQQVLLERQFHVPVIFVTAFATEDRFRRIGAKHSQVRDRLSEITLKERQVLDLIVEAGEMNES